MTQMRTRFLPLTKSQIHNCIYCGTELTWHQLQCGKNVEVAVEYGCDRLPRKPNGAGNHFNFIPVHDCRRKANERIETLQAELARYVGSSASAFRRQWLEIKRNFACIYGDEARANSARALRVLRKSRCSTDRTVTLIQEQLDYLIPLATSFADWSSKR